MNTEMKTYPSDLSEEEWQLIIPHLPANSLIGRPRQYQWRNIINGICYVLRTGCQWRYVPKEYASWQAVYRGFAKLGGQDFFHQLNDWLTVEVRLEAGREAAASAGVIDAQTSKSSPTASFHGYDAGKKTKGSKRHILVDTLGLLISVVVHCASTVDCRGAKLVFDKAADTQPASRLEHIWADGGYDRIMCYEAANDHDWRLEVLERPAGTKSFVVIKKRWVVERTFSWLVANRRLARDYERKSCHSEAFIYLAMCRLMLARLVK
jgi:putative transposase